MKGKIIIVFFLLLGAGYLLFSWYNGHKIESFCNALSTETRVDSLLQIATDYGVAAKPGARTLTAGLKQDDGSYLAFVASSMAMGETGCFIRHDGQKVLSVTYEEH